MTDFFATPDGIYALIGIGVFALFAIGMLVRELVDVIAESAHESGEGSTK